MKNKNKSKEYKTVYTCDFCDMEFQTKKEVDEHELNCEKNPENKNVVLTITNKKCITICFVLFFIIYIFTYFVANANANAQSNGMSIRDLLQPQKWFSSEEKNSNVIVNVTPTSIPTSIPTVKPTLIPKKNSPILKLNANSTFEMINSYRKERGMKPFTKSEELCGIADKRTDYLLEHIQEWYSLDEYSPDKGHLGIQEFRKLYSGKAMGENIGGYAKSNEQNFEGWKTSPAHNANMLATGWNGVVVDKACVSVKESPGNNIIVLLVGDK
jgi:uncharacterized protein YkwD